MDLLDNNNPRQKSPQQIEQLELEAWAKSTGAVPDEAAFAYVK